MARKIFLKFPADHNLIVLKSTYRIQCTALQLAYTAFVDGASLYSVPPHIFSAVAILNSLQISMPSMLSPGSMPQTCSTINNPLHLNNLSLPFILIPSINLSRKSSLRITVVPWVPTSVLSFPPATAPLHYLWNQVIITSLPIFPAAL